MGGFPIGDKTETVVSMSSMTIFQFLDAKQNSYFEWLKRANTLGGSGSIVGLLLAIVKNASGRMGIFVFPFRPTAPQDLKWNCPEFKRLRTIGTGDFSHMCKVARAESTNFPFRVTYAL